MLVITVTSSPLWWQSVTMTKRQKYHVKSSDWFTDRIDKQAEFLLFSQSRSIGFLNTSNFVKGDIIKISSKFQCKFDMIFVSWDDDCWNTGQLFCQFRYPKLLNVLLELKGRTFQDVCKIQSTVKNLFFRVEKTSKHRMSKYFINQFYLLNPAYWPPWIVLFIASGHRSLWWQ